MKLFENSWKDGYEYYERFFDTETKKSYSSKVNTLFEWYEQKSSGAYTYLLDKNINLSKVQSSNPKEGRGKYGFLDPLYRNIRDNYWNTSGFNFNPRIFYLDIETRVTKGKFPEPNLAEEEVSLIQIFDNYTNTVIMLGTRDWNHRHLFNYDYDVKYINCQNEIKLFENYFKIFKELNPSFIYAWNGMGFDYPYLYNRIKNLGMDVNLLSNYGKVNFRQNYNKETDKFEYDFSAVGHYYIDMMLVYKKFILKPRESYSLENIATVELKEHKVNHDEYITFDDFYLGNYTIPDNPTEEQANSAIYKAAKAGDFELMREIGHSTFCYYGYKDPVLIKRLDDKLNFTSLMNTIADKMGCLISDTLGTVKSWSQFLLNVAYQNGKIMPASQDFDDPNVVGGYVKDPVIGLHEWGISEDVNSMYPLLGMVGFNMSPETFIPRHKLSPELREIIQKFFNNQDEAERLDITEEQWDYITSILVRDNVSLGINGAVFDKTNIGIIPTLVQEIYNSRKQAKKTMFKYEQRKVLIKDILHNLTDNNKIINSEIKEVLEYTEDELKSFDESSLKELLYLAENGELLWNTKQMTEKVLMNALYGALSNKYFILFNEQIAAAITGNGRYFIRKKAISIENTLQSLKKYNKPYMLYSDTDSVYFTIAPFMEEYKKLNPNLTIDEYVNWADSFENKIVQPAIQRTVDEFSKQLNAFNKDVIKSEREGIFDKIMFGAKKKYIARVRDSEGTRYPEDDPYIKVMGLEIIKGGTPTFSKKYLKEAIPVILDKSEGDLRNWIKDIRNRYIETPIYDISPVSKIGNVQYNIKDLDKNGRPKPLTAGTKSAMAYNNYIEQNKITGIYQKISSGDKAKRIFLQTPNKFHSNIISYNTENFTKEIKHCVDYDTTFSKTFLKPLQLMVNPLNWNVFKEETDNSDW